MEAVLETVDSTRRGWKPEELVGLVALLGGTLGLRLWGLDFPLYYDEGFHILAARSWLETRTFCIADCVQPYTRGNPFTLLVAFSFWLFGESPEAARLPSVLAGTLLVVAVFVWVRREVSAGAAWIAAGLCAIAPELIGWSQTARFYALQALLVWCGIVLVYSALNGRDLKRRTAGVLAVMGCLWLARQLQVSTLIPVAALGLWVLGWLVARRDTVSRRAQAALGLGGLVLALAVLVWQWPTFGQLWGQYRGATNLHNLADVENPFFYHSWFVRMYSYLYAFLPVAVVMAAATRPRPTWLMTVVFATSFVAHSFGAFKGDRLILYAFPFFFTIWAVALAEMAPRLVEYFRVGVRRVLPWAGPRLAAIGTYTALTLALAFAALNTEAAQTTVRLLTVSSEDWAGEPWYRGHADWTTARAAIEPFLQGADVVVSSAQIKTLYALDRTDVSLSRTQLFEAQDAEGNPGPEFWLYPITGRPIVSSAESVERIVSCHPSGLFLIESGHWRNPAVVTPETADAIESITEPVDVPRGTRTVVFRWEHGGSAAPAECGGGLEEWTVR